MATSFRLMNTDLPSVSDSNMRTDSLSVVDNTPSENSSRQCSVASVIINADDWGRDADTTNRSLECLHHKVVSSVSAMMFMEDSERAASLTHEYGVDTGLHLNFTMAFSALHSSHRLVEHQQRLCRFLKSHRLAPVLYHPGLVASFEYVVKAQLDEYERLYVVPANRIDGHHHMHLCDNVLRQELLPIGTIVRRSFSFDPNERGYLNRAYRFWQNRKLARRHLLADFFFALSPNDSIRMRRLFDVATRFNVEIAAHPVNRDEYRFLLHGECHRCLGANHVAHGYHLR